MSLGVGGGSVSMSMTTGYEPPPIPYQGTKKTGRNEQCPCKSGEKFKKCCGALCYKLLNKDKKQFAVFVPQHFSKQFFAC
jgi:hypothetical protein